MAESGIEKKQFCDKHDEETKCYCQECCVALCHSCSVTSVHKRHTLEDIAVVAEEIRTELTGQRNGMTRNIQEIKQSLEKSELKRQDRDTSAAAACQNIDIQIENINSEAKRLGIKMKEEITGIQSAEEKKFETHKKTKTNLLTLLETSVEEIDEAITSKSTKVLIEIRPKIETFSETRNHSTDVPVVTYPFFPVTKINTDSIKQQVGKLQSVDGPTFTASFNLEDIKKIDGAVYCDDIMISGIPMSIGVEQCRTDTGESAIDIYMYVNNESQQKYSVDFTLKLLHLFDDEKSVIRKANNTFEEKEFAGYGVAESITLQELSGFLDHNRLTVQATVNDIHVHVVESSTFGKPSRFGIREKCFIM